MEKEGINGERIIVKSKLSNIDSMAHGNVATNGHHEAIRFGDTVFDNMNPSGIKYDKWAYDLGVNDPLFFHYFNLSSKGF